MRVREWRAQLLYAVYRLRVCEMVTIQTFALPEDVPDRPHHPDAGYKFPKRSIGKKTVVNRSFQHTWFSKWPFLHYNGPVTS